MKADLILKNYEIAKERYAVLGALEAVYSGQSVFGSEIISKLPSLLNQKPEFDYSDYEINERELEVIKEIADGHSNKEIAANLYLSEGTVRNYLSTILDKLGLRDRTQLAIFYYKHNKKTLLS